MHCHTQLTAHLNAPDIKIEKFDGSVCVEIFINKFEAIDGYKSDQTVRPNKDLYFGLV